VIRLRPGDRARPGAFPAGASPTPQSIRHVPGPARAAIPISGRCWCPRASGRRAPALTQSPRRHRVSVRFEALDRSGENCEAAGPAAAATGPRNRPRKRPAAAGPGHRRPATCKRASGRCGHTAAAARTRHCGARCRQPARARARPTRRSDCRHPQANSQQPPPPVAAGTAARFVPSPR
jgi:hypothetical protein